MSVPFLKAGAHATNKFVDQSACLEDVGDKSGGYDLLLFSVRLWHMIEVGCPFTMFTLLRISEAVDIPPDEILSGLTQHLRTRKKGRGTANRREGRRKSSRQ